MKAIKKFLEYNESLASDLMQGKEISDIDKENILNILKMGLTNES